MEATGSSIDQHDAQKSGRRGSGGGAGGSFSTSNGSKTNSPSGQNSSNNHSYHTPGNSPPSGGGGEGTGAYGEYSSGGDHHTRDLSPRSEDSVPLTKVHALRGDAWQLKQMESVGDYDGDEDDDGEDDDDDVNDDGTFQDNDAPASTTAIESKAERKPSIAIADVKPQARQGSSLGHHSDSDAAAIAMLSMKESLASKERARGSGVSSDGGDSSGPDGRARFKRKAFVPLTSVGGGNGKRKMSFATILN